MILDDLLELAAVPAPTFAEGERIAWLERRLRDAVGERRRDDAGNLIWTWGTERPRLLLLVHVDTVFPAETSLSFVREGDRITGPGIGDNAAAVAVVVDVVAGVDAPGLAVAFTVGEEGLGNLRGAFAACRALRPEAAVAVEGHGLDRVIVDSVGSVRARVRVTGPGGHSWEDRGRPSAIHALLELGRTVVALGTHETPVNVGLVAGGRSINTIAPEAELVVEMRAVEPGPLDAFERRLAALAVDPPLRVDVEVLGRRPAGRLDQSSPLLQAVRRVRQRLGLPDDLAAGSTDASAALAEGIPALTLGVARGGGSHTPDEWVEAPSFDVGRAQLAEVLTEWLDI